MVGRPVSPTSTTARTAACLAAYDLKKCPFAVFFIACAEEKNTQYTQEIKPMTPQEEWDARKEERDAYAMFMFGFALLVLFLALLGDYRRQRQPAT